MAVAVAAAVDDVAVGKAGPLVGSATLPGSL